MAVKRYINGFADSGKVRLGGESPSFGPIRASVR
jgi:hypothetical protein